MQFNSETIDLGVRSAFFVMAPEATEDCFCRWQSGIPKSDKDPRTELLSPAALCESALERLGQDGNYSDERFGQIVFALGHYQTLIEVLTVVRNFR